MKEVIKTSIKSLLTDRLLLWTYIFMVLLALIFATIIALSIHPSELQLVSHYSAFGVTHLYRDQWFYLIVFVVFELVAVLLHVLISVKLLTIKGRSLAIMFAWYGVAIEILGFVTAMAVINYWIP